MLDWAINNNVEVVRGNHEHMFLMFMAGRLPEHQYYDNFIGGLQTVQSYEQVTEAKLIEHLQFIGTLPNYIVHDKYVFVHGGININKPAKSQTLDDMVWDGTTFFKTPGLKNKVVVFGHHHTDIIREELNQPMTEKPYIWYDEVHYNKIGIDCGCRGKDRKNMACLDLTNGLEYYINVYDNYKEVREIDKNIHNKFGI
jgi:serine/threonine protein phosphatase 1